ncbi:recombination regulator RecX [Bacillus solitudinis]|uniref:recombination regulator RecX n=1 Tax=Bacillus solitudinis TaxID=2014074 RepID=UPI000C235EF4|nr:recombination regulator RecX [Bacillus solitudinis]
MVKITKITVQKRNLERYNIFLARGEGEEYGFSVDQDVLIKCGLKKGLEINEDEIKAIIEEDDKKKTYHLALHFLSYRMRSIGEVKSYLTKKERQQSHIDFTVEKLIEQRFLDDKAFAEAYVKTKKNTTLKGPKKIKQELKDKEVSEIIIDHALLIYSEHEQLLRLEKWLDKQWSRKGKQSLVAYQQKLVQRLLSKGFNYEIIDQALKKVAIEENLEEEWEAVLYQGMKIKLKQEKKFKGWDLKQRIKQNLYSKGFSASLIDKFIEGNYEE